MLQRGYLTTQEAAERSGLTINHLSLLLRKGIIKGKKISTIWLINEASFNKYIAGQPKPGPKKGTKRLDKLH